MLVPALPRKKVDEIFRYFEAAYGSLFIDRWKNGDIEEVKALWATELAPFADGPHCFSSALRAMISDGLKFPPSLPEFVQLCRRCYKPESRAALQAPGEVTSKDRAPELAAKILNKPRDYRAWAHELKARRESGEILSLIQQQLASEALGENWT
jgi:hypothetical protein